MGLFIGLSVGRLVCLYVAESVCLSLNRLVFHSVSCLLLSRSVCCSVGLSVRWPIYRSICRQLFGQFAFWSICANRFAVGTLVYWSVCRPVGHLSLGRPVCWLACLADSICPQFFSASVYFCRFVWICLTVYRSVGLSFTQSCCLLHNQFVDRSVGLSAVFCQSVFRSICVNRFDSRHVRQTSDT